jgi:hypothetical protein
MAVVRVLSEESREKQEPFFISLRVFSTTRVWLE